MHEALQPVVEQKNFILRVGGGTGENFDKTGKPFAGRATETLTKPAAKSIMRKKRQCPDFGARLCEPQPCEMSKSLSENGSVGHLG